MYRLLSIVTAARLPFPYRWHELNVKSYFKSRETHLELGTSTMPSFPPERTLLLYLSSIIIIFFPSFNNNLWPHWARHHCGLPPFTCEALHHTWPRLGPCFSALASERWTWVALINPPPAGNPFSLVATASYRYIAQLTLPFIKRFLPPPLRTRRTRVERSRIPWRRPWMWMKHWRDGEQ